MPEATTDHKPEGSLTVDSKANTSRILRGYIDAVLVSKDNNPLDPKKMKERMVLDKHLSNSSFYQGDSSEDGPSQLNLNFSNNDRVRRLVIIGHALEALAKGKLSEYGMPVDVDEAKLKKALKPSILEKIKQKVTPTKQDGLLFGRFSGGRVPKNVAIKLIKLYEEELEKGISEVASDEEIQAELNIKIEPNSTHPDIKTTGDVLVAYAKLNTLIPPTRAKARASDQWRRNELARREEWTGQVKRGLVSSSQS